MVSVEVLICPCGMRLKTPGAVPGRVGKCPRCGSMLRVPELSAAVVEEPRDARPTFVDRRPKKSPKKPLAPGVAGGLVKAPRMLEERWQDCLDYPLRADASLAILVFMPVGFWFATVPLFGLVPTLAAGTGLSLFALIFLFPSLLILAVVGAQTFTYLGQVLVTSAIGELFPPRLPGWDFSEMGATLGRWFWALLIGVVIGGAPAMVYWIYCGEVDWLDRIVLIDLIIPGLAYALMALLATLIHESPLAANPVTVLAAIWRVGRSYVAPCVLTGSVVLILGFALEVVMRIKDMIGQAIAFWLFWVVLIYTSMLALRWLGLFCHDHAKQLGWFPGRRYDLDH